LRERRGLEPLQAGRTDWKAWRESRLERLAGITRASLRMDLVYHLLNL
jgi:hypothetical protein